MVEAVEYRKIPDSDEDELLEILEYSFSPHYEYADGWESPLLDKYTWYGFYSDDTLLAVASEFRVGSTVRGGDADAVVMKHFGATPEHRRSSAIKRGIAEAVRSLGDRGVRFAYIEEFKPGFYDRFGAPKVGNVREWSCPASALSSVVRVQKGEFQRFDRDSLNVLDEVYRHHADRYSFSIGRNEQCWNVVASDHFENPLHVVGWKRDGELRGYMIYAITREATIDVVDMGYLDHEAYRHLLYYLSTHHSQTQEVSFRGPEEPGPYDPLDVVGSPDQIECEIVPGPVLRVADVRGALETPAYPERVDETVTVEVNDRLVSDVAGTYELSVQDGVGTCLPVDAEPDVSMNVSDLAQLYVGYRDVEALERVTNLTIHDERARASLSKLFPEQRNYVYTEF